MKLKNARNPAVCRHWNYFELTLCQNKKKHKTAWMDHVETTQRYISLSFTALIVNHVSAQSLVKVFGTMAQICLCLPFSAVWNHCCKVCDGPCFPSSAFALRKWKTVELSHGPRRRSARPIPCMSNLSCGCLPNPNLYLDAQTHIIDRQLHCNAVR